MDKLLTRRHRAGIPESVGWGRRRTVELMLRELGRTAPAARIEQAVIACIKAGETTIDLGGTLSTTAAGDAVLRRLKEA